MLGRRLLVLAAVLVGLAALAASVSPRESVGPTDVGSSPPPSASSGAQEAAPAPAPDSIRGAQAGETVTDVRGEPVLRRFDARRPLGTIEVKVGQRLRLEIRNTELSSVQMGRDGPIQPIDPDSPARFDLLYSTPARREIVLYGPGLTNRRVVGALDVEPA